MSSTIFFFFFIPLVSFILLVINLVFAPRNPYMEKNSAFECGFSSFLGQNRTQFSISFFIFALLFLLFDLEILLVYPYLVSAYVNEMYGLLILLIFLLALTIGFVFELGKKALTIDSRQTYDNQKRMLSTSRSKDYKDKDNVFNLVIMQSSFMNCKIFNRNFWGEYLIKLKNKFTIKRIVLIFSTIILTYCFRYWLQHGSDWDLTKFPVFLTLMLTSSAFYISVKTLLEEVFEVNFDEASEGHGISKMPMGLNGESEIGNTTKTVTSNKSGPKGQSFAMESNNEGRATNPTDADSSYTGSNRPNISNFPSNIDNDAETQTLLQTNPNLVSHWGRLYKPRREGVFVITHEERPSTEAPLWNAWVWFKGVLSSERLDLIERIKAERIAQEKSWESADREKILKWEREQSQVKPRPQSQLMSCFNKDTGERHFDKDCSNMEENGIVISPKVSEEIAEQYGYGKKNLFLRIGIAISSTEYLDESAKKFCDAFESGDPIPYREKKKWMSRAKTMVEQLTILQGISDQRINADLDSASLVYESNTATRPNIPRDTNKYVDTSNPLNVLRAADEYIMDGKHPAINTKATHDERRAFIRAIHDKIDSISRDNGRIREKVMKKKYW